MNSPGSCCPDDGGGSHYHCPYCGCTCSMVGHLDAAGRPKWCPPPEERPSYAARFVDAEALARLEAETRSLN